MVPAEVTQAVLATEMVAAHAWAKRRCWSVTEDMEALTLTARTVHPADNQPLVLHGAFDGYRALPPIWRFLDPVTGEPTRTALASEYDVNRGTLQQAVNILKAEGLLTNRGGARNGYLVLKLPEPQPDIADLASRVERQRNLRSCLLMADGH